MTAGKDVPASHELAHVAQRLASFAAGCLGTSSPAKTGSRLGVMGNVSEAELREILHHIEVLSKQRAAGLAGQSSGYPESSPSETSGSSFQQALKEACGVDAEHLHLYLPRDAGGKVDLLQIFRMENGKAAAEAPANYVGTSGGCDAFADFVDHPADLPKAPDELPSLNSEVDPAQWLQDTVAINALRSAIFHKVAVAEADRLLSVSKRCRSRRPALCKTALRAMAELADSDLPAEASAAWIAHGAELTEACLAAMPVTKVTAKMGEETLDAVCRRLQAEATTDEVLQVLCKLQCPEVRHPACVAAMLRVMGTCLGRASSANLPSDKLGLDSLDVASDFCEEIMKNRRLSPAFSEARAVQRLLTERRG
eukprot:s1279_g16.t1